MKYSVNNFQYIAGSNEVLTEKLFFGYLAYTCQLAKNVQETCKQHKLWQYIIDEIKDNNSHRYRSSTEPLVFYLCRNPWSSVVWQQNRQLDSRESWFLEQICTWLCSYQYCWSPLGRIGITLLHLCWDHCWRKGVQVNWSARQNSESSDFLFAVSIPYIQIGHFWNLVPLPKIILPLS